MGKDDFPQVFTPFSSLWPVTTAFESFEFPLDFKESMFLLLSLLGLLSGLHVERQRFLGRSFRDLPQRSTDMQSMGENWPGFAEILCYSGLEVHP